MRRWTPTRTSWRSTSPIRPGWSLSRGGVVERMALALQASLLVRYSPPAVADAFCATRLDGDRGRAFGTLPGGVAFEAIINRARLGDSGALVA